MRIIVSNKKIFLILLSFTGIIYAFSIFTTSDGYYRKYFTNQLPFSYRIHQSAPIGWIDTIGLGTQAWNNVSASYFEFTYGGTTVMNQPAQDGINLVYFDFVGDNFEPGTNTIAFSRTYTSGSGVTYHAVESDLIWNARDYAPATNGDPNAQDLQSVITHEFGHHLGLGHAGDAGSPPGVGDLILDATMYGYSSQGDTTKRSLHIDDIMGVISIYPRWIIEGSLTDSSTGSPLQNAFYYLNGNTTAELYPPVNVGDRWQIAGYVRSDTIEVDGASGLFTIIPRSSELNITMHGYGYQTIDTSLVLDSTSVDSIVYLNLTMKESPYYNVTIEVYDSLSMQSIEAKVNYYASKDLTGNITQTDSTQGNGIAVTNIVKDIYTIEINPQLPYVYSVFENVTINKDTTIQLLLNKADILIVDDDFSNGMALKDNREDFYFDLVASLPEDNSFAYKEMDVDVLSDSATMAEIPIVIWFFGNNPQSAIDDNKESVRQYLNSGGKLLITGNAPFTAIADSVFLAEDLHGINGGISSSQVLRGEVGDPIGNNELIGINIASAEMIAKDTSAYSSNVFTFLAQSAAGIIKYDYVYRLVFCSFDLSDIITTNPAFLQPDVVFQRVIDWFNSAPTGIENSTELLPLKIELYQNYPNPFNPNTNIRFVLSKEGKVNLIVFNILGEKVKTISDNKKFSAGYHNVNFNGDNLSSGTYFVRMHTDDYNKSIKVLLLK
jgi:hypothetical protein